LSLKINQRNNGDTTTLPQAAKRAQFKMFEDKNDTKHETDFTTTNSFHFFEVMRALSLIHSHPFVPGFITWLHDQFF